MAVSVGSIRRTLRHFSTSVVALTVVALLVLAVVGVWFYRDQEQALRGQAEDELSMIAGLKAAQISAWRTDRLLDGERMMQSPSIELFVNRWLEDPADPANADGMTRLLASLRFVDRYTHVLLIDGQGGILLQAGESTLESLHVEALDAVREAFDARSAALSILYSVPNEPGTHLDVVTPLADDVGIVFHADANDFLFPLVESWPTSSETAETLLVRREGEDALVLNSPRHTELDALTMRVPLDSADVTIVRALLGETGILEGPDYRGVPVLSYAVPIPDSSWYMIAEVDTEEAFAEWRARSRFIILLLLAMAGVIVGSVIGAWQLMRASRLAELVAEQRARHEMEGRFKVTLESVGDGVISTDAECRVRFMNPVAEELTGWSAQEARGRPLDEVFVIINEETREPVDTPATCVMRDGAVVGLANHTVLISRDGTERPLAHSGAPIRGDSEEVIGVVLVFRDQTEERAAANALAASEQRFRLLVEGAPDAIFVQTQGNLAYVNEAMCVLLGAESASDLLGRPVLDFLHPDHRESAGQRIRAINERRERASAREVVFLRLNGTEVHAETAGVPVDYEGHEGALVFVRDITERLDAERALRESQDVLRIAGELARLGGWSADIEESAVYWSDEVAAIHEVPAGFSPTVDQAISFYAPEHREVIARAFAACVRDGVGFDEELQIITTTGQRRWVRAIGAPESNESGRIVGIRGALQDISEQKAAEVELSRHREHLEELVAERTRELEETNRELNQATRAKSAFLANMSHELRTPLNSIIGFSGVLGEGLAGPLSEEQRTQIAMINRSGKHLLELIDEVLDLSKIESGKMVYHPDRFDPTDLLAEAARTLEPLALEKGIELRLDAVEQGFFMYTDPGKVKQILLNLVGNAVKFTETGHVSLGLRACGDGQVEFAVTDTGSGIPEERLQDIFAPFTQMEEGWDRKPEGTGLGLTISRQFAEFLGGSLSVESEVGRGSRFVLTLPIERSQG